MAQQGEKRLLNEWLAETHRQHLTMRNVRLGKAVNQQEAAMYSVMQRYADAVVIDGGTIVIVEAKIKPSAGAVGQLEHYKLLLADTPEFSQHRDKAVKLVLLSAFESGDVRALCATKNIDFILYSPEWAKMAFA